MVAILLKCLLTLPSFPEIISVIAATFCLHPLPLEREKTRATIKVPAPVIQPYASSTQVVSSFFLTTRYFYYALCYIPEVRLVFLSRHTAAMRRDKN